MFEHGETQGRPVEVLPRGASSARLVLMVAVGCALALTAVAGELPKADEVLRRIAERAEKTKQQAPRFEFTRVVTTSVLDDDGTVESSENKTYEMLPVEGELRARLVSNNGKPASAEEIRKEREEEAKARAKSRASRPGREGSMFRFLGAETAKRFDYEVVGEEEMAGRPAYVLSLRPKPGIPVRGIEEKVMAQIEGRLWVDEQEGEVVRIDSWLTKPLRLAFGVIGVLHEFRFSVERQRLGNGQWANSAVHLRLHFRELLATKRVRHDEICSDFRLLGAPEAAEN